MADGEEDTSFPLWLGGTIGLLFPAPSLLYENDSVISPFLKVNEKSFFSFSFFLDAGYCR